MSSSQPEPAIIGVVGWKNSGKTTLVERLITTFAQRGLRVASLKHAHHTFQIDEGPHDSARHRRAGARQVAMVSRNRWALICETPDEAPELGFREIVARLEPADIVVVEGYKAEAIPKIEVRRRKARAHDPMAPRDPNIIAIAADHVVADTQLPVFGLDDIAALADHIAARLQIGAPC